MISAIAAIGRNRELGKNNALLWTIPEDLKRFKMLTMGHPVIMGRKTYDSIFALLGRPLPNRTNIVVTRDTSWAHEGVIVRHTIEDAIQAATNSPNGNDVSIIGGAQIYELALPYTNRLCLTIIDAVADADSFFPEYKEFSRKISEEQHEWNGINYSWVDLERA